jgi:hypothetical protein
LAPHNLTHLGTQTKDNSMFDNVSTADKIQTIVDCFLRNGFANGAFGRISACADGHYDVQTDGRSFKVSWSTMGIWSVREGNMIGCDTDLGDAAAMLIGADLVRKAGRI